METWGEVPKSQTENDLITDAIATAITEHESDPVAHQGTGESLQNHKSDEVIDHPANSVVNDKLPAQSVTPDKISTDITNIFYKQKTSSQSITGDAEFADVTGLAITLACAQDCKAFISTCIFVLVGGSSAWPDIRIKLTNSAGTTYLPESFGWRMVNSRPNDNSYYDFGSFSMASMLLEGNNTIQIQAARTTPDETLSILGGLEARKSNLTIITVGSVVEEA